MVRRVFKQCVIWGFLGGCLVSCDRGPSQAELEAAEQARLAEVAREKKLEKERERERWKAEFAVKEEEARKEREKQRKLAEKEQAKAIKAKEQEVAEQQQEIDWKVIEDKMFARGSMANVSLGSLRTKSGKTYEDAEVKLANSVGITVFHRNGVDDIDYSELSTELQKKFLYDPIESADFKAGKALPRLPVERRRAVEDRIGEVLTAQYEAEVAEVEKRINDRRGAEELRRKAKVALMQAEDRLRTIQGARKANPELERRQKALVARYRKIMANAQNQLDTLPSRLQ